MTLIIPDDIGKFCIKADSSDYANDGVLSQKKEGKWYPVAFHSKSLNEVECNYEIYDKELMAIMDALSDWRQYLLGTSQKIEILTDHQNLQYFKKPQKLNRRQARWMTELAEYEFELIHKPGKSMGKADALSRMTGLEKGEKDNENLVLLKPELFVGSISLENPEDCLLSDIRKRRKNLDRYVEQALRDKTDQWVESEDGLISWQGRIYVPRDKDLRGRVIYAHHDTPLTGHPG